MELYQIQIITTIITTSALAIGGYYAGWYSATDKIRFEIYRKRLNIYQKLNKLTSDIFILSMKAGIEPEKYDLQLTEARISLAEFITSNVIMLTNEVVNLTEPFRDKELRREVESLRKAFNALTERIHSELKIEDINKINESLLKSFTSNFKSFIGLEKRKTNKE